MYGIITHVVEMRIIICYFLCKGSYLWKGGNNIMGMKEMMC